MSRFVTPMLLVLPLALIATAPAAAQSNACTPQSGSDEEFQQEIARSWLPFRIGVDVARASCRVNAFFEDLLKRKPDPDKVTLDDVIESSKPDTGTRHDASYDAKRARMPSPTTQPGWNPNPTTSIVVLPPTTAGGVSVLYQPNEPGGPTPSSLAGIQGNGTLLSTDGMKRGNFVGGKLNGVGEEIDPNGTWRSGTYEYGKSVGYTFEVRPINGKTYLVAGSVVNGKLDGMVERIYADGSRQFEDWEGGKLMQVGIRAPKGQSAIAPQVRYRPRAEVATEGAYKRTGPRTRIAPGTTFDPARTVTPANSSDQRFLNSYPANLDPKYRGTYRRYVDGMLSACRSEMARFSDRDKTDWSNGAINSTLQTYAVWRIFDAQKNFDESFQLFHEGRAGGGIGTPGTNMNLCMMQAVLASPLP